MSEETGLNDFHLSQDNDNAFDFDINEEEIKMLDERRASRLAGNSKTLSWEEAKKLIIRKNRN